MRLIINTATTSKGGSVQVAKSFIEECINIPDNSYHIIVGPSLKELIKKEQFPDNFHFYHIGYRPATRVLSFKSSSSFFREIEKKIEPDVVFTTSGPAYWRPNAPHLVGYNLPHYIYRDSPFFKLIPIMDKMQWILRGSIIKYFYKRDADAYVVQTNDVKERLADWLNTAKPVFEVSNTCSHHYFNPDPYKGKFALKNKKGFKLLVFSSYYLHKNIELIPAIVDKMNPYQKENILFILTLKKEEYEKVFPKKYRNNVINIGPIPPQHGPSLYRECNAMFLPSLLECFSASYPEAMAMERPIITSDLGFARSICETSAVFFNPLDPLDALTKIENIMNDEKMRHRLVKSGKERLYSFLPPDKRAKEYLRICEKIK